MNIGDRVRVKGIYINKNHIESINDKCAGATGIIKSKAAITDWLVVFDEPVHYIENKYWLDMPFYEEELEVI